MFELKKLSINDGIDVYNMYQDIPKEENGLFNGANGLTLEEFKNYLIKKDNEANQVGLVDGWKVPSTTYILYVDGVPVGYASLRHFLTDALRVQGGHIGYGIAKSYRGKGYGKEILKRMLSEAKKIGIDEALITTYPDNLASQKVILANGGREVDRNDHHVYFLVKTKELMEG